MQAIIRPWQRTPFLRLLLPLVMGIASGWSIPLLVSGTLMTLALAFLLAYRVLPLSTGFAIRLWTGLAVHLLLLGAGLFLYRWHDIRHTQGWIGGRDYNGLLVRLEEPLIRKKNSWKAEATALALYTDSGKEKAAGKLILYFAPGDIDHRLRYGSLLLVHERLQTVKGSGNPAAFDYGRWCRFQGITHQVYLRKERFAVISGNDEKWWKASVFSIRAWVLQTLRGYFDDPATLGLAEALLIGYKDDLDKNLLQSYSNTGVVHVIAISGLHLGLIYSILLLLTKPLAASPASRSLRLVCMLLGLWLFSIVAGAGPSIIRSAVMFSCIAAGTVLQRKTAILNTLALSAFLLLCYNPYWLWDAGFQLSYTAVWSIVLYYRAVYNWCYFRNRLLDAAWKITAVSIAAQLLTLPVSTYHFNQFPTWFLFTNIIAVPLSSAILVGEILLCAFAFLHPTLLAVLVEKGMQWMNRAILYFDTLSHPAWTGLSISFPQALLLAGFLICLCHWLQEKSRTALYGWCCCLLLFCSLRTASFLACGAQQRLVVYHIPGYSAMDLVSGRQFLFMGDRRLGAALHRMHLQPLRTHSRTTAAPARDGGPYFRFGRHTVFILHGNPAGLPARKEISVLLVGKTSFQMAESILKNHAVRQLVVDGSAPSRLAGKLKEACRRLRIPFHHVRENGAFVLEG